MSLKRSYFTDAERIRLSFEPFAPGDPPIGYMDVSNTQLSIALVPLGDDTDTEGPRGTCACACVSRDPRSCLVARSDSMPSMGEQCECLCHGWGDEE